MLNLVATGQKTKEEGALVMAPRSAKEGEDMKDLSLMVSEGDVLLTDLRVQMIAR